MEKGKHTSVEYILKYMDFDTKEYMESYILEYINKEYYHFSSIEEVYSVFGDFYDKYLEKLSYIEMENIKSYTGYQFRNINALLRNNWTYEVNGILDKDMEALFSNMSIIINQALGKVDSLPVNMKTYRGVDLSSFSAYHIQKIEDLMFLKGNYLYESGFTSTSIIRETSFYYVPSEWGKKANIEIEYLIPEGSDDGVLLSSENLTCSSVQNEYLIRSSSLFKVIDVNIDSIRQVAKLLVMLVPEKVWNPVDYAREKTEIGKSK